MKNLLNDKGKMRLSKFFIVMYEGKKDCQSSLVICIQVKRDCQGDIQGDTICIIF